MFQPSHRGVVSPPTPIHLGAFLKMLRDRHGISQAEVLKHLPLWTQSAFSKVEKDTRAPTFDQLVPIYQALAQAGVHLTVQDRQQFVLLARRKLEGMKTRHQRRADADWDHLRVTLAQIDHLPLQFSRQERSASRPAQPRLVESRHLIGREEWLASMIAQVRGAFPKKLLILQGPPGIGKTSELYRLANLLLESIPRYDIVSYELSRLDRDVSMDVALELLLSTILEAIASPYASLPTTSLQARITYVLDYLARGEKSTLILLDNAEYILDKRGELAPVWRLFLTKFMQASHSATLILATKEWPGSFAEEMQLVAFSMIPPFSRGEGNTLLRRLGVRNVTEKLVDQVVEAVGGIPLCLQWVARLVQEPLLRNDWADFEEEAGSEAIVSRLLEDSSLFGGPVAERLQPLLDRVVTHLSPEALTALRELAVACVALGSPALKVLYHDPAPLKELRDASLLVAAPKTRVQLLPMVAASIRVQLTDEQICVAEDRLIQALTCWLETDISDLHEQGTIFTGLANLLLRRHRLLAAADVILYHGWLTSQIGQILRLASLVQQVLDARPWPDSPETEAETECGRILLHYYLDSYLGMKIDAQERAEAHQRIRSCIATGQVSVDPLMEVHLVDRMMLALLNTNHFDEAQRLLDECSQRFASLLPIDVELQAMLLSKQAMVYSRQSGYLQFLGQAEQARQVRNQTIALYEQCLCLIEEAERTVKKGSLRESTLKKKRASFLNSLAYQFNVGGRYEKALATVNQCLKLREQGYAERDSLPATLGEKSQILAALGHFQEALRLDEQTREEIQQLADAGDTSSQEERWIYQVNQGRLFLLLGRVDEAERLLLEAEPQIHERRMVYKMQAEQLRNEIQQWRATSGASFYQLDWRWVERFRTLCAYDAYWWLAHAGPFTDEEQQQWDAMFPPVDSQTKDQLKRLLLHSRDREVEAALQEGHEPRLRYPAIEIEQVRQRITGLLALNADIEQEEPNAIVRRLYHGAIEDEVCFLQIIEATYEGDSDQYWARTQQMYPPPTPEEMQYAFRRVAEVIAQGRSREDTRKLSEQTLKILQAWGAFSHHLHLEGRGVHVMPQPHPFEIAPRQQRLVSPQAARRFFEAAFRESGYTGWQVRLDPSASGPRVESGLRHLYIPDRPMPLEDIREYLAHELLGHVTRSVAGEHSLLGLLGMGTKGYSPTEEGLADYHERHVATLHKDRFDDSGTWMGPLAIGLACGIVTPPQTFLSLFLFLEPFLLLYRLLWRNDEDRPTAEERAHNNARIRCLRTFRGTPDLSKPGVCFTKDVVYLRGYLQIERAVAEDEAVLDRLAVGKVALAQLPELQELGIVAPTQGAALRTIAYDTDLDNYILSFEA